MNPRVLVAGGGIAGMCSAICLARAGYRVDLAESDPDWKALGAGMTLNGASLRALGKLGVLAAVMSQGSTSNVRTLFDGKARLIREVNTPDYYGKGVPNIGGILRPVLHNLLQSEVRQAGVDCRLGLAVSSVDQRPDSARANFSDGTADVYRFVVAADGFASTLRAQLIPEAPAPVYTGQACWRAVVSRPPEVVGSRMYMGRQMVGLNPVSRDQMYLFLLQLLPEKTRIEPEDWLTALRAHLQEFTGLVAEIREGLGAHSQINYRPLEYFVLPKPWYRGRVVFVGDAAHATTPHGAYGAGLGVEDALILGELAQQRLPVPQMFAQFSERRFERCRAVVVGSVHLGELEIQHATPQEFAAATDALHRIIMQPA